MPYRVHTEYLEQLYLHNQLSQNKFKIGGSTISLSDLQVPLFVLGTETDHVAPWKSVYKIHHLTQAELTFVLNNGGHNAGVVSGPEHSRRRYRIDTRKPGDKYIDPDTWLDGHMCAQTGLQTVARRAWRIRIRLAGKRCQQRDRAGWKTTGSHGTLTFEREMSGVLPGEMSTWSV